MYVSLVIACSFVLLTPSRSRTIFAPEGGTWVQRAVLFAAEPRAEAKLGTSIAWAEAGRTIIAGAATYDPSGAKRGAVSRFSANGDPSLPSTQWSHRFMCVGRSCTKGGDSPALTFTRGARRYSLPQAGVSQRVGTSVAANDNWVVTGGPGEITSTFAGSVFLIPTKHMEAASGDSLFVHLANSGCLSDAENPVPVMLRPGVHVAPRLGVTLRGAGCQIRGTNSTHRAVIRMGASTSASPFQVDDANVQVVDVVFDHFATDVQMAPAAQPARGGVLKVLGPTAATSRKTVQLSRVKFTGGSAERGGIMFASGSVDVVLDACAMELGSASEGGALFASDGARVYVFDTSFRNNSALRNGGGVVVGAGSTFALNPVVAGRGQPRMELSLFLGNQAA